MKKHNNKEIAKARKILSESGYFVQNLWCKTDIDVICEQMNINHLDDIQDFFDFVGNKHDASIGINWDTLEIYLEMYLENNK